MAEVVCGTCALWNGGTNRCRVTNAVRVATDFCGLTAAQKLSLLKQSRLIAGASSTGRRVDILSVTTCPNGGHITFTYSVDGGPQQTRMLQRSELVEVTDYLSLESLVLIAMRSLLLLCGVTTGQAAKTVLEGSSFWIPQGVK